ncbi:VOC family protein [Cucumibacter marinus]|uniref:VOC family protein n=1 Tax=Cucumibacter marinus TaxID=1121252 RepID=UPI0004044904|nr:VOC family protein [Cucumibacter marinus]
MTVRRIVTNIAADQLDKARSFYGDVLDMDIAMDQGWIVTFAAGEAATRPQISVMTEGGSGTPVPDISIEVDDFDETLERARRAGFVIEYGPTNEDWGVKRFYVRDPFGRLVNILTHV